MTPSRLFPTRPSLAVCLVLAVSLAACGGGNRADEASSRAAPPALALATDIAIEGCVVDERHELRPGRTVRAIDAQSRVLGETVSAAQGESSLQVGGQQWVRVAVGPDGVDTLQARAGAQDVWLSFCLTDRST